MDLCSLWMFFAYTCRWQKTNQARASISYVCKGTHWGEAKVQRLKNRLVELGLIQNVQKRDEEGKVSGWYVKVLHLAKAASRSSESEDVDQILGFAGSCETEVQMLKDSKYKCSRTSSPPKAPKPKLPKPPTDSDPRHHSVTSQWKERFESVHPPEVRNTIKGHDVARLKEFLKSYPSVTVEAFYTVADRAWRHELDSVFPTPCKFSVTLASLCDHWTEITAYLASAKANGHGRNGGSRGYNDQGGATFSI